MEQAEKIQILQDLIRLHTVNGNEIIVAQYLQKLLAQHGIEAAVDEFGDKRANLQAAIGQTTDPAKVLVLTGHQDTVTVGDPADWEHDPFGAEIVGDKLYGRGASDMKSGLAAAAITLIELKEQGVELNGSLRLVATAGEEYGTPGAYRLNEQHAVDDATAMVVCEPTDGQIIYAHSGSFNYRITSTGKAAHSSTPSRGINAIAGLVNYINLEQGLFADAPTDEYLGDVQHSVTVIKGGDQVNTIPDQAELLGNIRPTYAFNNQQVIDRLETTLAKLNQEHAAQLKLEIIHNFEPVETKKDNEFVKLAQQAALNNFQDRQVELQTMNGATDASVFIKNNHQLPTVILGADNSQTDHQLNEYTTVSCYLELINVYQELVKEYLK